MTKASESAPGADELASASFDHLVGPSDERWWRREGPTRTEKALVLDYLVGSDKKGPSRTRPSARALLGFTTKSNGTALQSGGRRASHPSKCGPRTPPPCETHPPMV